MAQEEEEVAQEVLQSEEEAEDKEAIKEPDRDLIEALVFYAETLRLKGEAELSFIGPSAT